MGKKKKKSKAEKSAKYGDASHIVRTTVTREVTTTTKHATGSSTASGNNDTSKLISGANSNSSSGGSPKKRRSGVQNLLDGDGLGKRKAGKRGSGKKSRRLAVSFVRSDHPRGRGRSSTSSNSGSKETELLWTGWGAPNLQGSMKEKSADSESISASDGADERLTYGVASLTGRRQSNEDEYVAVLNMGFKKVKVGLFGVFDGHGGPEVSKMLEKEMPRLLKERTRTPNESGLRKAITEVFLDVDERIIRRKMKGGSTGVVAMLTDDKLIVGSVGDSRCLVCDNGKKYEMTRDHEIDDSEEQQRILQAGYRPYVDSDNELRIEGLNMSRSFGDIELKKNVSLGLTEQAVIAVPRIRSMELRPSLEFMVLACDGVFEVMTNQDVVEFVRKSLRRGKTAEITACGLAKKAIREGSNDNVTVIIVDFMHNVAGKPWRMRASPSPAPTATRRDTDSSDAGGATSRTLSAQASTLRGSPSKSVTRSKSKSRTKSKSSSSSSSSSSS